MKRLAFFATLLCVLSFSLWGRAQVRIDDKNVLLDDGQSLEQAIDSGTVGQVCSPVMLQRTVTAVTIAGNVAGTARTALWSTTIPANTLGTTRALRATLAGAYSCPTAPATAGVTFWVHYGGTVLWSDAEGAQNLANRAWRMEFIILNTTSTSAQSVTGNVQFSFQSTGTPGPGTGVITGGNNLQGTGVFQGTSAVNSGQDQVIGVDASVTNTLADCVLTLRFAQLEIL